ncbi:L-threonylcarbamoyladenylate synthase [Staphylococcus pseudintermedius]|uniref:L-threonylcarbamoyladenylate synthase n=1 Tax=Staphylococcus pseudintermedius TaxID=283734 RepID=UPI000E2537C3|nr:L-threonylcarbamoyladenylate synthase [Staphylococcus pseudintermedius]EGQ3507228.1 threonylcarbamoyl-AMP synthase [Staphylococcus pseudintermedius]EGQ3913049.1 threonylcarbamoyl-AMP synthase [Staphylococcus pseudintermedius]EIE3582025.1 threonylcarbamoyl-AMP synthase [Staphylococcus pseudintermedius]EJO7208461.1 threonylcarbamoyl-AMP synthase [Staphylococcus pseudintermedius]EJY6930184.1 threonylcarbamoyl-AMP synthase [Staphylococcus pseudintermedius]
MSETKIWDVRDYTTRLEEYPKLPEIVKTLQDGGLVVLPTETVYGLGGNAKDDTAIRKIYEAKGRPSDNPLIVHIYDTDQLDDFVVDISEATHKLMEAFWPGPITFILPLKQGYLCDRVTGGLNSVAVRMPSHPVALALLKAVDLPIAAPSANLSGRPSPTTFEHAFHDLNHRVDGIMRSTQSDAGLESTVVDCTSFPFRIARPGTITRNMLNDILPQSVEVHSPLATEKPIAPGMKYRHYAPSTPLKMIVQLNVPIHEDAHEDWSKIAFIVPETKKKFLPASAQVIVISESESDIQGANHNLYDVLHQLDQLNDVDMAYIYGFEDNFETEALRNRMLKAVSQQVVKDESL